MKGRAREEKDTGYTGVSEERIKFLVKIANAYYQQKATQQEIAQTFGVSRSQISRYIDEARELGIVQIHIVSPDDRNIQLEDEFRSIFPHLRYIEIVPFYGEEIRHSWNFIGRATAKYMQGMMTNGHRLGVGAGRTVRNVVSWLKPTAYDVTVVQIVGSTGYRAQNVDYNELANVAAKNLGAPVYYLNAPAILGKNSGTARELIANNSMLSETVGMSKSCHIYLLGIGSAQSNELYVLSGMLDENDLENARKNGAVGNICGSFYKLDGSVCPTDFDRRVVGIDLEDMKKAEYSIGVATGNDKAVSILGALRGKYINVLFTDEKTAKEVLSLNGI